MATKQRRASKIGGPSAKNDHNGKRKYMSQADVPAYSLSKAIKVPQAIADNYGKAPTRPLRVAEALNQQPTTSHFRMLTGAAIAYGLTEGGYNADQISITALGRRIVSSTVEGDELAARREALLKPRVIREFLTRYNGSRLPSDQIAKNVLEEMGVPPDRTAITLELVLESGRDVGFVRELKGQAYVDLESTPVPSLPSSTEDNESQVLAPPVEQSEGTVERMIARVDATTGSAQRNNRVFITHGKNREIVGQLKELLTFGNLEPVVAVEHETISKPIPDKVMDDMRSCSAAIIHVGTEMRLLGQNGEEHPILNPNVLIEIGAAMALYRRNFILLVERGVELPSNLQGLSKVPLDGDRLDYAATMTLLKVFNDFRNETPE